MPAGQKTENVQIFPSAGFIWLFQSKFIQNYLKIISCLRFELIRVQPYWLTLYEWRPEKGWLMTYLRVFCHTIWPWLWRHWYRLLRTKWQQWGSCFLRLSNVNFLTNRKDKKKSSENWYMYTDRAHDVVFRFSSAEMFIAVHTYSLCKQGYWDFSNSDTGYTSCNIT